MEFRYDENRISVEDVLSIGSADQTTAIMGGIRLIASMVWDGDSYCNKEDAVQEIMKLSMLELTQLSNKFKEVADEYNLLKGLFGK